MKKITIPEIEIELADNLFLRIREVEYIPGEPTVMYYKDGSGYPGSDAEIDWKETALIIRKVKYVTNDGGKSTKKEVREYDFEIDGEFANNYYDELLNRAEEILNEQ